MGKNKYITREVETRENKKYITKENSFHATLLKQDDKEKWFHRLLIIRPKCFLCLFSFLAFIHALYLQEYSSIAEMLMRDITYSFKSAIVTSV